ncbi:MAG: histidine phosphatase family protein [Actinomycetota bacterium]|nr:histidine phosphatase family protein [Actinomycetota bacterium]
MTVTTTAIDSGPKFRSPENRMVNAKQRMQLVIVRHGETNWTLTGRYTGTTDVDLTANGRREAASMSTLLQRVLTDQRAVVVSSPLRRATETAALALPECRVSVDPLVMEYDYGEFEGLTTEQIRRQAPGWDIWRDGCPGGESTEDVGRRADEFLHTHAEKGPRPVVVVTHGHFSRILAARALGLAPESGRLFASATAAVSLIEDQHGERCIGLWNVAAALLDGTADAQVQPVPPGPARLVSAAGRRP